MQLDDLGFCVHLSGYSSAAQPVPKSDEAEIKLRLANSLTEMTAAEILLLAKGRLLVQQVQPYPRVHAGCCTGRSASIGTDCARMRIDMC